jgi:iron(II)-dependent oxidoreductase
MDTVLSPTSDELTAWVEDARDRTIELVADLTDQQLRGPLLQIINPLLWEIGHVAWFQERWVLRRPRSAPKEQLSHLQEGWGPSLSPNADALYDSAHVPHDDRWTLPLPPRTEVLDYLQRVRDRAQEQLRTGDPTEEDIYFQCLAVFHEDMHTEAFTYTRQTLDYPPPQLSLPATRDDLDDGPLPGDVSVPGGTLLLGASRDLPFVFDNEKWAHPVEVPPFRIARAPVTNRMFADFVQAAGYQRREWWSEEGWQWRQQYGVEQPLYWVRDRPGRWLRRQFDYLVPLEPHHPVLHVNWHEAEAYCRYAGRRLPTEAEWEMAASTEPSPDSRRIQERKRRYPWGDEPPTPAHANLDWSAGGCIDVGALPAGDSAWGCRQMIGNVWEWTSSPFLPYPGFVVDPYKEYSEPWFGTRKVLRGGCWTTRSRLIRNTWRNFYTPDRRDVWAGFRTCAL